MLPVVFLVKFQAHDFVQVFQARGWQLTLPDTHAHNVHDDVRHHHQTLISPVLFYTRFEAKPPNLKTAKFPPIWYM